ncbi:hypothetical protein [Arcanobacterium hippocoleae]|uniref:hypothetical protein n=1 Tax=Arcanobacterium hippocoleae TaxID=149017 RepID=UPI003341B04E
MLKMGSNSFPPELPFLARLGQRISDYKSPLLAGIASILTFAAEVPSTPGWAILLAGIFAFIAALIAAIDSRRKSSLEKELGTAKAQAENSFKAINNSLKHIAENLSRELDLWSPDIRVTIYAHLNDTQEFTLLIRRSANPTIEQINRKRYPNKQGRIGEAWSTGSSLVFTRLLRQLKSQRLLLVLKRKHMMRCLLSCFAVWLLGLNLRTPLSGSCFGSRIKRMVLLWRAVLWMLFAKMPL